MLAKRERRPKSAYDRGLDLLARRAHFVAELRAKLARRGYAEAEVDDAVERLLADGFLNEREAADLLARSLQRRGYGRLRVQRDLERRGADESAASDVLGRVADEDEQERAAAAAARWRGARPARGDAALARHLERRGFARRTIGAVLFDAADESANEEGAGGDGSC